MSFPVLEAQNLSKVYLHKKGIFQQASPVVAIDNLNLTIEKGKILSVVGESGSGKSTLARLLVGSELPSKGTIKVDGSDISQASQRFRREVHRKIRLIFQHANQSLNPRIRIHSLLDDTLRFNTPLTASQRYTKIRETLKLVGVRGEHADRYPHMLSMGERQRVAIARAIILEPLVIVADEPLSHLDMSIQAQILNLLLDLQEQLSLSYVFISNDLGVIKHISDNVLVLCNGKMMEYGASDTIFDHPLHPYTRAMLSSNPNIVEDTDALISIQKIQKSLTQKPAEGCPFQKRCPFSSQTCEKRTPPIIQHGTTQVACHKLDELGELTELRRELGH